MMQWMIIYERQINNSTHANRRTAQSIVTTKKVPLAAESVATVLNEFISSEYAISA